MASNKNCLVIGFKGWLILTLVMVLSPGFFNPASAQDQKAAVHVTAGDYTSSAHAVVNVDPAGGTRSKQLDMGAQASTDLIIRSYGNFFYVIGRYYTDNLTKYAIGDPDNAIYQESLLAEGAASSNPHDLIFVNANKAYVPMYQLTAGWVINPADGKKTGEFDLSAYADSDGAPEMTVGVLVGEKLFILLQRLDMTTYAPSNDAYLAVIDINTNQEIDTGQAAPGSGLKGILLPGRNPGSIQYLPENDTIYVACTGQYPGYGTGEYDYTGGIITINPNTYEAVKLVDDGPDGTEGDHPYGAFSSVMVVSPTNGYFIGYKGWGDNYLYKFNPTTGEVAADTIPAFDGKMLVRATLKDPFGGPITNTIEALDGLNLIGGSSGAPLDKNGMLWIGVGGTSHSIFILNTSTDIVDEIVDVNMNPDSMAFCPQTIWPGENNINSATGSGVIEVSIDLGVVHDMAVSESSDYPDAANKPEGKNFTDGLLGFRVDGLADGATVKVTITFPSARGDDAKYYKINAAGNFVQVEDSLIEIVDEHTIILTLTDGGDLDQDGEANGSITDPGGWAWTPSSGGNDGGGGSSGGGCFLGLLP